MHAAALIDGMLAEALRISREHGDARVTRLDIEISPTGEVTEDEVRTRLFVLGQGTNAAGAEVVITISARRFRCFSCGETFTTREAGLSADCLQCGNVAVCTDEARDCVLSAIEVADPNSRAH